MISTRAVALGSRTIRSTHRADGSIIMTNAEALEPYARALPDLLSTCAQRWPNRPFLVEHRLDGSRRTLTYAEALASARVLGQAFLARGLDARRGIAIIAENGIDHALVALGALCAGIPYAPLSPAYALLADDLTILRTMVNTIGPGLIYVQDARRYARAITDLQSESVSFVAGDPDEHRAHVEHLADLLRTPIGPEILAATAALTPEHVAKILFTSASTGPAKGVITTHRMLCSNTQMLRQVYPFVREEPPVVVDWLPWSHVFGGSHIFDAVLAHGGTYHVSPGKPTPDAFAATLRIIAEVGPNVHFDVPRGYDLFVSALSADHDAARASLRNMRLFVYAGASLTPALWERLCALAPASIGEHLTVASSLGATETAPMATAATWFADTTANIGIPVPGVTIKLVPIDERYEVRFRGPNVTPGYLGDPDRTAAAFDDEGFYRIGDAVRLRDRSNLAAGLIHDGRLTEEFKLSTGTWVRAGALRSAMLAQFAPFLRDVAIVGENRNDILAIGIPDDIACREQIASDLPRDADLADVLAHPSLRAIFQQRLDHAAVRARGSADRVARLVLLERMPSLAAGEITDKGTLNGRALLRSLGTTIEAIYADLPPQNAFLARPLSTERPAPSSTGPCQV
jgi:feruloyl-CoA synthase